MNFNLDELKNIIQIIVGTIQILNVVLPYVVKFIKERKKMIINKNVLAINFIIHAAPRPHYC